LVAANGAALALWGYSPALLTLIFALIGGAVIVRDPRAFRMNPVMVKELRGRMRGIRAFMVITIYLGLMSAFTVLLYLIQAQQQAVTSSAAGGIIGRVLFAGVVGVELLLIIFIAPSFTAGAITGERERKTYDLLQTTLLASPSFVIGKLESALGYVLLLLLSAIPLQSIAFLFGGVSETEVILSFVILAVTAIGLGTVGLFFSTSVERTLSASVRAYTVALVITFGVPVVLLILLSVIETIMRGASASGVLPAWVEILTVYFRDFLISLNPITTAVYTQQLLINNQQIGFGLTTLSSTGATIPNVSPWITFSIMYLVMSALLIVLSVRRMRRIEA
jgi:ABC-2 type transport system permease protein